MTIPVEERLNLSGVRVLSVRVEEKTIECDIESTQGDALCQRCGQKATAFHETEKALCLRHLPQCRRPVILWLRPQRYGCLYCTGNATTTERQAGYDAKAGCK